MNKLNNLSYYLKGLSSSIVGGDLSDLIKTDWFCSLSYNSKLEVVRDIAYQVLRALCFMHAVGIAHLDVKRMNFYVHN